MSIQSYTEEGSPLKDVKGVVDSFTISNAGWSQDKYIKRFDIGTEHKGEITCNNAYGGKKIQIKIYHKDKPNENLLNEMWDTIQQTDLLNDDTKGRYYIKNPQKLKSIAQCVGGVLYEEQEKAKQNKKDFFGEVYVSASNEAYDNLKKYLTSLTDIKDEVLLNTLRGWDDIPENATGLDIVQYIKDKIQKLETQDFPHNMGANTQMWLASFAFNMQNAKLKQPLFPQFGHTEGDGFVFKKGSTSEVLPEARISKERYEMLCNVQFFIRCVPDCTLLADKKSDLRTLPYDNNGNKRNFPERKINIIDHNNYLGYGDMNMNDRVFNWRSYTSWARSENTPEEIIVKGRIYNFYINMAEANLDMAFNIAKMKGRNKIHLIVPGIGAWGKEKKTLITKQIILAYTIAVQRLVDKHKNNPQNSQIANYDNIELHFLSSKDELRSYGLRQKENEYTFDLMDYLKDVSGNLKPDEVNKIKFYQFDYTNNLDDFPENNGIDEWFYCHPGDHQAWYGNDTLLKTALEGEIYTGSAEQTAAKTNFLAPFGNQNTKFNDKGVFQWNLKTMATPNKFITFINDQLLVQNNGNKEKNKPPKILDNNLKNQPQKPETEEEIANDKEITDKNETQEVDKKINGLELYKKFYIADLENRKRQLQENQEIQEEDEMQKQNINETNNAKLDGRKVKKNQRKPKNELSSLQTLTLPPRDNNVGVGKKNIFLPVINQFQKHILPNSINSNHQNLGVLSTRGDFNTNSLTSTSTKTSSLSGRQSDIKENKNQQSNQSVQEPNETNNGNTSNSNNVVEEKESYASSIFLGMLGGTGIGVGIFFKKKLPVMIVCFVVGGSAIIACAVFSVKTYRKNNSKPNSDLNNTRNNGIQK